MTNDSRNRLQAKIVAGILGAFLVPIHASNIAVIRTAKEIVIAADSAGVIRGDGLSPSDESVCKIYRIEDAQFFAVSGLVNDFRSGYSVAALVGANAHSGNTISTKLDKIERVVSPALLQEVAELKTRDPRGYDALINAKGAVSVVLAGIENGIPVATTFSVGLTRSSDGTIQTTVIRDSCPGNCQSGVRAFSIGASTAIDALRLRGALPSLAMPDLAEYMVQAEIDAGTGGVSGPVDVLRLTPSGPVWVRKKASCPAAAAPESH